MSELQMSVALPPSARVPEYAAAAEKAGCARVWLYDSPALYGDIWVAAARAAEATTHIGVATGVAVHSLRHPLVTASAIATIEELAPGRLTCAFGTGFTARRALGQKPLRWAEVGAFYRRLRELLDGRVVEIDGSPCQMLHLPGWAADRPIRTPLWLAPGGPKGMAVAADVDADGLLLMNLPGKPLAGDRPVALIAQGTVLRSGEDHTSQRVIDAAGPWYAAMWHGLYEVAPEHLTTLPGGATWLEQMQALRPPEQRHLAVHEGHICALTDRDRAAIGDAGAGILEYGWTGDAAKIRESAQRSAALGVTEIVYAPAGSDIPGEIENFVEAISSSSVTV